MKKPTLQEMFNTKDHYFDWDEGVWYNKETHQEMKRLTDEEFLEKIDRKLRFQEIIADKMLSKAGGK